ncbi:hypothetical protein COU57_00530 [Candidatus Pacearchaeota archaeon CG10_big_fil_rev_8_21_14_0_10_32_14]|nr:MAG: hypothetical protein COU57_00530 [Candidatus Pacearchaeota archaeon CG10_big_fil_rev_8_21_14_0_10_32_14]
MTEEKYRRPKIRALYFNRNSKDNVRIRKVIVLEDLSDSRFERYKLEIPYKRTNYPVIYERRYKARDEEEGVLKTFEGVIVESISELLDEWNKTSSKNESSKKRLHQKKT